MAGFVSRTLSHKEQFRALLETDNKISLPTLHVFGDTYRLDCLSHYRIIKVKLVRVIEGEMSEELLTSAQLKL